MKVEWWSFEFYHVFADSIILKTIHLLLIFADELGHKIDHFLRTP